MNSKIYSISDLTEDVQTVLNFLRERGVIGNDIGVDAVTILTEDGQELEVDLSEGIEVEIPVNIIQKIQCYADRN